VVVQPSSVRLEIRPPQEPAPIPVIGDKVDCFAAAVQELLDTALAVVGAGFRSEGTATDRARAGLEAFMALLVKQPAASRMCLVESYAAGEPGVVPIRQTIDRFGLRVQAAVGEIPGRGEMPLQLGRSIVGGIYRVIYDRLQGRREDELPALVPALWDWAMSYRPPPQPLRTRPRRGRAPAEGSMPPFAALDPEQRIIRAFAAAVAEKGYEATTLSDIAAAGSISLSSFYEHFRDKSDAMDAALDSSGAQMLAATLPRASRAPDWPSAVRVALGASCGFLAAEPAFARLRMVEVYAAGPAAIARREAAGTFLFQTLLGPDVEGAPEIEPITLEATIGAVYGAFYDTIRSEGSSSLPGLAPLLTYLSLAPLIGAEEACAVANG
jgi:AcrR family transcriptional regulator